MSSIGQSGTVASSVMSWLAGAGMVVKEGSRQGISFLVLGYTKESVDGVVVYSEEGSDRATVMSKVVASDDGVKRLNSGLGAGDLAAGVRSALIRSGVFFSVDLEGNVPRAIRIYDLIPIGMLDKESLLTSVAKISRARGAVFDVYEAFVAQTRGKAKPRPGPKRSAE